MSVYTSDTVYCDTYDCPYGYSLIDMADQEECKNGQCEMSKCCNKVCSSYNCPQNHEPVNDAYTTVCKTPVAAQTSVARRVSCIQTTPNARSSFICYISDVSGHYYVCRRREEIHGGPFNGTNTIASDP